MLKVYENESFVKLKVVSFAMPVKKV